MIRRRAAALLAVLAAVLTSTALLVPGVAAAAPGSAATDYGSCLDQQKKGSLLLLIDTSNSLHASDKDNHRITAAQYLLDKMSGFADQHKVALDVAVSGFSDDYRRVIDWTTLNKGSVAGLKGDVAAKFTGDNSGSGTDYWTALEGARRDLADRNPKATQLTPCQAIAWFTDGKLELVPHAGETKPYPVPGGTPIGDQAGADAASRQAFSDLCKSGGIADGLRRQGIVTFAIGLQGPDWKPGDFDLMTGIATGSPVALPGGPTQPCGRVDGPAPGVFSSATDLDSLLQAFDQIPTPGTQQTTPICQGTVADCANSGQYRHQFVLDSSVEQVHILGNAGAPDIQAWMVPPDGSAPRQLDRRDGTPATLTIGVTTVAYSWRPGSNSVEATMTHAGNAASWSGQWALVFVDPAGRTSRNNATTSIQITSNLLPKLLARDSTRFTTGGTVPVTIGLVRSDDGTAFPATNLQGTVSLAVQLVGPDGKAIGTPTTLDKNAIGTAFPLDLTQVQAGAAQLRLTLSITTKPPAGATYPGTALEPVVVPEPITVVAAADYPTIEPPAVKFLVDGGKTSGTATITAIGPGCVWLDPDTKPTLDLPVDGNPVLTINSDGQTSGTSCVPLAAGERKDLTLTLSTDRPTNATASGILTVHIAPAGRPQEAKPNSVSFTADLRTPLDPLTFSAALIVALLLGLGIPVALFYALKYFGARIPYRQLSGRLIPVTVSGGQVLREGVPFAVAETDFVDLLPLSRSTQRKLPVGGGVELRTRVSLHPLRPEFVVVDRPDYPLIGASSEFPPSHGSKLQGRLPLAVHNTWTVLQDPAGPPDQAMVLMLVGADTAPEQRQQLGVDVAGRLPEVLDRLRRAAAAKGLPVDTRDLAGAIPGGFGGPPGGGGAPYTPFGPPPDAPAYAQNPFGGPPPGAYGPGSTRSYEAGSPFGGPPVHPPPDETPTSRVGGSPPEVPTHSYGPPPTHPFGGPPPGAPTNPFGGPQPTTPSGGPAGAPTNPFGARPGPGTDQPSQSWPAPDDRTDQHGRPYGPPN